MNISITNNCNRRCEYCFQRNWYLPQKLNDKSQIKEMSVTDFSDLITWYMKAEASRGNNQQIALMGGEPLLHSDFLSILHVLYSWHLTPLIISNISIDSEQFNRVINNKANWLINTDYTDQQEQTFIENFKCLCHTDCHIGISTTLMPNSKSIIRSANRIKQLASLYKQIRGSLWDLNLRLSPYSPNPCSSYVVYDFSIDIANFLNITWSLGKINTNFDCRINHCELSENAIAEFRNAGIEIRTDSCGPYGMPFDVLVDGSCIWCSSANFLRLNNWRDYDDFDQAKSELTKQWFEHWKRVGLKCNYKQCNKFNPAICCGMCIAKNEFISEV